MHRKTSGFELTGYSLGVFTRTREDLLPPNIFEIGDWKGPFSYTHKEQRVKLHTHVPHVAPWTLTCQHNKKKNTYENNNDIEVSNDSKRTTSNINKHSNTSYIARTP